MIEKFQKNNSMAKSNKSVDKLEQYDYLVDDNQLEITEIKKTFGNLMGSFLINFSFFEHDLNIAIAEFISQRSHDMGYLIIEGLTMYNKIDLFIKMYSQLEAQARENKSKKELHNIIISMREINQFRNNIAHANWQSMTRDGFVRIKIVVDNNDGYIKFKKIKLTTKMFKEKNIQVNSLINAMFEYTEKAFNF
ncbi:MAG: hypothetical protein WCW61_02690 [Patescibacteria group bacterium]